MNVFVLQAVSQSLTPGVNCPTFCLDFWITLAYFASNSVFIDQRIFLWHIQHLFSYFLSVRFSDFSVCIYVCLFLPYSSITSPQWKVCACFFRDWSGWKLSDRGGWRCFLKILFRFVGGAPLRRKKGSQKEIISIQRMGPGKLKEMLE